jgi:NADH dehydrogenase
MRAVGYWQQRETSMSVPHRVVIVGGGFGGLKAARGLKRAAVQVTLVDRRNFHLFQPLLYQVATGALSPANIATPLRAILKRQKNVEVQLGEVTGFDVAKRHILLADRQIPYETLIVAAGAADFYFGHPEWEQLAPGLKTIEDATEIRRRILSAFEAAEAEDQPEAAEAWLTFVIVGAGPTGVELSGAVAELARHTLRPEFRRIDPARARIILVEGADRVLPSYPADLSAQAAKSLERLGVTVRVGEIVTDLKSHAVVLRRGSREETVSARNVFWAAGTRAAGLGAALAAATGAATDKGGRIRVESDCTLPGHPEIFVIGDLAHFTYGMNKPLPGVAQVALQQGAYAAKLIAARLNDRTLPPMHYHDLGTMSTIGRAAAVAQIKKLHLHGHLAWLVWLFVHLMSLVGFENRMLVFIQWAWSYWTRNRSARLITGKPAKTQD